MPENRLPAEDSGFETGPTSWETPSSVGIVERTDADAFDGDWSLWVTVEDDPGVSAFASTARRSGVPWAEGETLQIAAEQRLTARGDASIPPPPLGGGIETRLAVWWYDDTDTFLGADTWDGDPPPESGAWVSVQRPVVTAPSGAVTARIIVGLVSSTTEVPGLLCDDVYVGPPGPIEADVSEHIGTAGSGATGIEAATNVSADVTVAGAGETTVEGSIGADVDITPDPTVATRLTLQAAAAADVSPTATAEAVIAWSPPATSRDMPSPVVEAAMGQPWSTPLDELEWTEVPNCVRLVRKQEGRSSRLDAVEPGECRLILDNRDGALDPSNTESPFWQSGRPGLDYGTWIRVSLDLGGEDPEPWFLGTVDRIHPTWELGDAVVEIDLVDALAILAQERLRVSVLREEVMRDASVGHLWPMSEAGITIQDVAGAADGAWTQEVTTSEGVTPYDPSRCTLLPAGDGDSTPVSGAITTVDLSGDWTFGFVVEPEQMSVPSDSTHTVPLVTMPGATGLRVTYSATSSPNDAAYSRRVAVGFDGPALSIVRTVAPPTPLLVLVANDTSAGQTRTRISIPAATQSGTRTVTLDLDDEIVIRPDTDEQAEVRIQEMFLVDRALSDAELDELATAAFAPWASDTTAERFERVCALSGLPSAVDGTGWPDASPATIAGQNMLDHAIEAANGDGATITVELDSGSPLYRQTDPDDVVMWWDTRGELGAPLLDLDPRYGIDRLAAVVKVRRGTGEFHTSVDAGSPYPPSAEIEIDTLLDDPGDARDWAALVLADRRKPRYLLDTIVTEGRDARVPQTGLLLRPGDHVGVLAHPPGRSTIVQVASVERVQQVLDYRTWSWHIEYGCDRVTMYIAWDDLIARHDDWDEVIAAYPTWFDALASGEPIPPEGS